MPVRTRPATRCAVRRPPPPGFMTAARSGAGLPTVRKNPCGPTEATSVPGGHVRKERQPPERHGQCRERRPHGPAGWTGVIAEGTGPGQASLPGFQAPVRTANMRYRGLTGIVRIRSRCLRTATCSRWDESCWHEADSVCLDNLKVTKQGQIGGFKTW